MVQHALRRHGIADHHRPAGAHDAGLLAADALAVRPQEFHMVDVDAGDDGAIGVDHIGGIQPPAQAHLENRHIQPGLAHQPQDGQRGELEIGERHFRALHARLLHGLELRQQLDGLHDLAAHAAAFLEMHQMRRCVDAGAKARLQRHGLQHGAGRAFAVGARHRDHGAVETQVQALGNFAHAIQAQRNILGVQALAIGEPCIQCGK